VRPNGGNGTAARMEMLGQVAPPSRATRLRRAWRRALRRPPAFVGAAVVLLFVVMAVGMAATPTYIRLTRGLVLSTKEENYVQSARALGGGDVRMMTRHILPNIFSALLVQATVSIPGAIIAEAILSFLGLGVQPPTPSWGTMLNTAQQFLETAPWMAWWPGLAIFSLALSFNLAGDGLRDFLDPKDY